jgi:hypothetical protein
MRFAGTCAVYSKKAIPQLIRIIAGNPRLLNQLNSLNFRWPYQAIVMNVFESNSKPTVETARNEIMGEGFIFYTCVICCFPSRNHAF